MAEWTNDFSRLDKVLRGEKPDRIPIVELDIGVKVKEEFLGRPILSARDEVEFWQKAGYDYVPYKLPLEFVLSKEEAGGDAQTIREDGGILAGCPDLDEYPWPDVDAMDLTYLDQLLEALPESMKLIPICGGFLSRPMLMMGYEEFCYALVDEPEYVEDLFYRVGETILKAFAKVKDREKIGALWISCDMGYTEGLLVSDRHLRELVFPWFGQVKNLCNEMNIPLILHSDGKLNAVMEDFIEIGINAIHPIEPQAMDIYSLKEQYGDRIAIFGNVDVDLLYRGTPEEIAANRKQLLDAFEEKGGYCLGSGNSVPDGVPLANYLALIGK